VSLDISLDLIINHFQAIKFTLTFVFLSTHSSHESVGLFCFFFGGSPDCEKDAFPIAIASPTPFLTGTGEPTKVLSVVVVAGDIAEYITGDTGSILVLVSISQ
jgi:hypothetical protein